MYKRSYNNKKLDITENHLKILSLFTNGFNNEYYIREVQRLLKISPRTAQLILDNLEKKNVLESKTRGKIRIYKIKKTMIAKEFLILTENYKKISFLEEHDLIREILSKIKPFFKGIIIIFGSYAKGIEKKDSDLDIFVTGEYKEDEIDKISKLYGTDINIKKYPLSFFKKDIKKDIFLKEILKDHIIISGIEDFIKIVMKDG